MLVTSPGMRGIGYPTRRIGWADCIVPHPDQDGEVLHARSLSARSARPRQRNSRFRRRRPLWDAAEALGLSGLLRRTGRLIRPWRKCGAKWKQRVAPVLARNWQEWGAPRWAREALGLLLRRPFFSQVLSTKSRAEALSLLFLFVAKGSPNRDQINAPHRKRRDSVARCLSGAIWRSPGTPYQDRAAALLFEDGRSWLLDSDVIVSSVGRLPSESSLLTHVWKAGKSNSGGVREVVSPRSDGLEAAAYRLFRSLGSPAGSALILLDDQHPPLPLVEHGQSRIRRALFLIGCPAGLSPSQEHAFARAARCAGWQVLRLRLGKASEFASKMVLRLQVWHSCGRLLPSLDAMTVPGGGHGKTEGPFLPWPSQRNLATDYDSGALTKVAVHFLVPIEAELSELLDRKGPHSSAARDALALATRSAVAAVCHSKGGWRGCQITLCFRCGGMITIRGRLADRLVHTSLALSERVFLKELKKSGLKQQEEASSGIRVHRGQKISCGGAVVLDLAANGSSRVPALPNKDSALNAIHPAEKLRAALGQRPESFFVDLGTKKVTAAPHHVAAALRGCERANAPEVIGILQSALLGEESSSMEILRTVLKTPRP
ncbi:ARF1 [Symbiodinium sp. CCMP2456]|nr:ARF1 [Symbiodinium sp. CCMP2456]